MTEQFERGDSIYCASIKAASNLLYLQKEHKELSRNYLRVQKFDEVCLPSEETFFSQDQLLCGQREGSFKEYSMCGQD